MLAIIARGVRQSYSKNELSEILAPWFSRVFEAADAFDADAVAFESLERRVLERATSERLPLQALCDRMLDEEKVSHAETLRAIFIGWSVGMIKPVRHDATPVAVGL
jgi:hypothetical protein